MSLFEELKRRNVFRVGIAYLITAWLLLQVVDLVLENINSPDWVMQVFMLALAVGFPVTLLIAWAFEMTPEGLKKEKDVDRSRSMTQVTGRKLDRAIIGVLVLALGYFVYDKFGAGSEPAAPATVVTEGTGTETQAQNRKSIAVLPFANRSSREEDAFFAEGIHDDLLTSLAKVGALKVISRTSVLRYRDSGLSIPEIAKELGVATVLEGGIQRSGGQVRINVQLIDANTDEHLWAENYDRALTAENLFLIQSEISREIVSALQATLTDEESQRLAEQPTDSLEAYGEFVLGRQEMAKRTNESLSRAQAHFEKAIELDPDYALAYVGLADTISLQANYGDLFVTDTYAPRQAALDRALSIDPNSGEAYTSLANLREDQNQDEAAEKFYKKATEQSPNYVTAWHWYANFLEGLDRHEEALSLTYKAVELDPNAPILSTLLSGVLWNMGRAEEAFEVARRQLKKTPEFPNTYSQMASMFFQLGRLGEAAQWSKAGAELDATSSGAPVALCNIQVQLGAIEESRACYDRVEESYPEAAFGARIMLHQLTGDYPAALETMRAIAEQFPFEGAQVWLGYNLETSGLFEEALGVVEKNWPELLGEEPVIIDDDNDNRVTMAAHALLVTGNKQRANYLFDQVLDYYSGMNRTGAGETSGTRDVFIHAMRGDKQKAIVALREAIDAGWRGFWFRLRYPLFDPLLEEPEWIELMTRLEADIARQRQWFENHKDDPLF